MFIHFAFGNLGKSEKLEEQTAALIQYVLREKRLKVSKCVEFTPILPSRESKPIPLKPFRTVEGRNDLVVAEINGGRLADVDSIRYLPEDVSMICFIKIAFSQLKNSDHAREYGKLGVVLSNDFLRTNGIRPVQYYTEESLYADPLILRWHQGRAGRKLPDAEARQLQKEITAYRKPARLFPSFARSITHLIHFGRGQPLTGTFTYDRYPEGYDFTKENEYRIVMSEGDYLSFEEADLHLVLAQDLEMKRRIEGFFHQYWRREPEVEVYPA